MHRPARVRIPQIALAVLIALGAFGSSGAPGIAPAAAAAAPASSRVLTSYLLRSSLSYATGTITTSETITIRNTTERAHHLDQPVGHAARLRRAGLAVKAPARRRRRDRYLDEHLQPARRLRAVACARCDGQAHAFVRRQGQRHDRDVPRGPPVEGQRDHAGRALVPDRLRRSQHALPGRLRSRPAPRAGSAPRSRPSRRRSGSRPRAAAISLVGRTHIYELEYARDFAFGASPYYKSVSGTAAGVPVRAWYTTGDGSTALKHAMAALARFEQTFGSYQWPTLRRRPDRAQGFGQRISRDRVPWQLGDGRPRNGCA